MTSVLGLAWTPCWVPDERHTLQTRIPETRVGVLGNTRAADRHAESGLEGSDLLFVGVEILLEVIDSHPPIQVVTQKSVRIQRHALV